MFKLIRRTRQVLDTRGITLVELLVGLVVFSIVAIAVLTVMVSSLGAYIRARDLSEINTLMDSLSALVMDDVISATELAPGLSENEFTITTVYEIKYFIDPPDEPGGVLMRNDAEVLAAEFYSAISLDAITLFFDEDEGVVTLTLTVTPGWGAKHIREYTARPVALQPSLEYNDS